MTYFWNAHRNEARGIGGLFFRLFKRNGRDTIQDRFNFVTEVGNSFLESMFLLFKKEKRFHLQELIKIGKKFEEVAM